MGSCVEVELRIRTEHLKMFDEFDIDLQKSINLYMAMVNRHLSRTHNSFEALKMLDDEELLQAVLTSCRATKEARKELKLKRIKCEELKERNASYKL